MVDNLSLGDMNTLNGDEINKKGELLYPGDEIGGYKIIHKLGAGGMGQVYLVENIQMHKKYAMKVLPPNLSRDKRFIDRFRVEARVMADLKHPNIVDVKTINHDKSRNLYYLVMEFIEFDNGKSADLGSLLKGKRKLSEEDALRIVKQLCSALDYAHNFRDGGIIHRDLKPANILIDSNGDAHITDFGLAKIVGTEYLHSMVERSMQLTIASNKKLKVEQSIGDMKTIVDDETGSSFSEDESDSAGSIIGTYEFMSPEQREGEEATKQSDIYSLGMIIYKLLTGKKAVGRFKLPTHFGKSEYWDDIIEKCLEHDSEDRFEAVTEIIKIIKTSIDMHYTEQSVNEDKENKYTVSDSEEDSETGDGKNTFFKLPRVNVCEIVSTKYVISENFIKTLFLNKIFLFVSFVLLASVLWFYFNHKYYKKYNIPSDLIPINNASYSPTKDLASGSATAQEKQIKAVKKTGLPLEVKTAKYEIQMRLIPAGSFLMGNPDDEYRLQHQVVINKTFYMGTYEITQKQWKEVMENTPSYFKNAGDNAPVEQVSWELCQEFFKRICDVLEVPRGTYRLPTEAEWEYSCRAGTSARFYFGDTLNDGKISRNSTMPIGSSKPNAFGLFDTNSNVAEWCLDKHEYPSKTTSRNDNEFEWIDFGHVIRGGHWRYNEHRISFETKKDKTIGFRIVRELSEKELNG